MKSICEVTSQVNAKSLAVYRAFVGAVPSGGAIRRAVYETVSMAVQGAVDVAVNGPVNGPVRDRVTK